MQKLKPLIVLGLLLATISASVSSGPAAARNPQPKGSEPIGTALWPSVAAQLAKNIAGASLTHKYSWVWAYLDPAYRRAVSESRWHKCQSRNPAAPRTVTVTKVDVASATELAVGLPLLGKRNVQQIELRVQFKSPAVAGPQYAILYSFWLKQGKSWTAVWLGGEYKAYKAGNCYLTPQGPPLY